MLLAGSEELVRSRLRSCADIDALALEITDVVERIQRREPSSSSSSLQQRPTPTAFIARVLGEVEALGWQRVVSIDATLRRLELRAVDSAGRAHSFSVALPLDYPASAPACSTSLPGEFVLSANASALPRAVGIVAAAASGGRGGAKRKRGDDDLDGDSGGEGGAGTLGRIVRAFEAELETYQPLWDVLDDFDAHFLVIQPAHPTRSDDYRRIAIGRHCSMHVKLDPLDPHAPCTVTFLGGETVVGPLRQRLRDAVGAARWERPNSTRLSGVESARKTKKQSEKSRVERAAAVRRNLERILKVKFPAPSKAAAQSDDISVECGICYAYELQRTDAAASAAGAGAAASAAALAAGGGEAMATDAAGGGGGSANAHAKDSASALIPNFACQNARCGRPFHRACLQLWLQALPSTRRSFDTMFGKCPYCSAALSLSAVA